MRKLRESVADVPRLLEEWDYEENSLHNIFPERLGSQSNTYAYWKCRYGHKWRAKINNRYNGRGCPECSKRMHTSFPEQAIYYYVKKKFPDAINSYKEIFSNGMEIDIYIPSQKIGIEYDGIAWHKESFIEKEIKKYEICKRESITLFRVKENRGHSDSVLAKVADHVIESKIVFRRGKRDYHYLDYVIRELLYFLGDEDCTFLMPLDGSLFIDLSKSTIYGTVKTDVDTQRDEHKIMSMFLSEMENKSFGRLYPQIARMWHPTKNGELTPFMFSPNSSVKMWWIGECGHEWKNEITVMTRGYGCPYRSGQRVLKGFNDLASRYPEIASQWHPSYNGIKMPDMFTHGSGYNAYWLCDTCGQTWQTRINARTKKGSGCPYCAHEKPIKGATDLLTLRPDLMLEWDYEKNSGIDPTDYMPNSNKKVWWKCSKCGYEYAANVNSRNRGTGCKRCAGQVLIPGKNDLETIFPKVAEEWNYDKNKDITPSQVFANSNKRYWWKCKRGHEWETNVNARARGSGCPICSGNIVLEGFNDLTTTHPEIAAEWHPNKNGGILPTQVSKGHTRKIWFICPKCNNSYETYIGNKVKGFGKCPFCSTKKTRAKYVYNLDTGEYFPTLKKAAESVGKEDISQIQMCCTGKCKTASGYHWEYRFKEDDN